MRSLKLSCDFRSVSDLKTRSSEILAAVTEEKRSIGLTRHGQPVAVLVPVEDYDTFMEWRRRQRLAEWLRMGDEDIAAGRTVPHAQVMEELRGLANGRQVE